MVKNPPAKARAKGDTGSIPESKISSEGGNGNPSRILAGKIQWTEEPGGLQSMELQRVGHDCAQL